VEGQFHIEMVKHGILEIFTDVLNINAVIFHEHFRDDCLYNIIDTLSNLTAHQFITDFVIDQTSLLETVFSFVLKPTQPILPHHRSIL
jgi:hypothetical protein